ncbi:DNA repair protein RadC [Bermanella marisrubri]|uniref:DNA repair protein RadC n=1 Tax=Bermanella marisrubri TaxID=207949 RepID=Q1N4C9_9GAMM|nr:DNA repair protein RadC [Bermanella marisrubri]EAT12936.1 DNA repair protein RadC [Oceanobacter sp. RED65] [Bermanella marisrubri]QIZ82933.1 DNA repair protein RadC [Bermanella marisrubri]
MSIKHWPQDQQPREKLLANGPTSLSDFELLAIFLRTGIPGLSAVELARDLIRRFGSLKNLFGTPLEEFCQVPGLGPAKYVQLQAVLEMAKRHLYESLEKGEGFSSPDSVERYLAHQLKHLPHEVFACLYLDNQHRLIAFEELFRGTIDGASVYPREVVKQVLAHNAAAVIFAHNHPSGIAEPSDSDIRITKRLQDALALVDVRVLDHFVVGDEVISFAQRGML